MQETIAKHADYVSFFREGAFIEKQKLQILHFYE
jgi:hypothetical protein